ncbi:hypothetical protein [Thermococcus sp.]|uniref:hypothetical protein n=1 Tax=Thermococcus sp. TaxID=35749 RepID=UPI002634011D|nr:hypothetical protein [Thermococcus sp.]
MKGYAALIVITLLVVGIAGCVGNGSSGTTTPMKTSPTATSMTATKTSTGPVASPTSIETTTQPKGKKEVSRSDLLENLNSVWSFTYVSNGTLKMTVSISTNGTSQTDNVTLRIIERGYVDLRDKRAWINSTAIGSPDGAQTNTSRIIIGETTYVRGLTGWIKINDTNLAAVVWNYNIVDLARKYLGEKPESTETNGSLVIMEYSVPYYDLTDLAREYFSISPKTKVEVSNGRLEFYFRNGEIAGGKLSFDVETSVQISDPLLGNATITQSGHWEQVITVTGINVKEEVKAPTT